MISGVDPGQGHRHGHPSRRALLGAGALAVGGAAVAGAGLARAGPVRRRLADPGPPGVVPDVPQAVTLEAVTSPARGRRVGLFVAVPADLPADRRDGLPVCLVLHGASATTADLPGFGLGRFLTAAVRDGVPPFALVAVDGGRSGWEGGPGDDPQRMLVEEVPRWCAERALDATRPTVHGWSMGGRGALLLAVRGELPLTAVAAFSPALSGDDEVHRRATALADLPVGLWCGTGDPLLDQAQRLAGEVPGGVDVAAWSPGRHTRDYWNRVTPDALAFVGHRLT